MLRVAACRQGLNCEGYQLRLDILLNSAMKLPPLFVDPDPLIHQRQPGFVAGALCNPAHENFPVRGTPGSCSAAAETLHTYV